MPRNECYFQFRISRVLRLISIFDLFIDSPSYDLDVLQPYVLSQLSLYMNTV
jgi:hypothetical protein